MGRIGFAKTAFLVAIGLSLLFGTLLSSNIRAIPGYTGLIEMGRQVLKSVLAMQTQEQRYLQHRQKDALENVRDELDHLKKLVGEYEKSNLREKEATFLDFAGLEEAMNLCEHLFDQFVLYDRVVEKNITEIRDLEDSILAVIFSKMNPERGIIALQEIRIHEKRYLLYRNRTETSEGRFYRNMRKRAVSDFLMWAQQDKRIEELMAKDNALFSEIINNHESLDNALQAIKREREKIKAVANKFLAEGQKGLHTINRRCIFLSTMFLLMWLVTGAVVITTSFSG